MKTFQGIPVQPTKKQLNEWAEYVGPLASAIGTAAFIGYNFLHAQPKAYDKGKSWLVERHRNLLSNNVAPKKADKDIKSHPLYDKLPDAWKMELHDEMRANHRYNDEHQAYRTRNKDLR